MVHTLVRAPLGFIVAMLTVATACGGGTGSAGTPGPLPAGTWGGTGISLEVKAAGTTVEFDCAHGTVDAIASAHNGAFSSSGSYVPEHGGPVREGETPQAYPATYSGSVDGDTMDLHVDVPDIPAALDFRLTRGKQGELRKCL